MKNDFQGAKEHHNHSHKQPRFQKSSMGGIFLHKAKWQEEKLLFISVPFDQKGQISPLQLNLGPSDESGGLRHNSAGV